jgi:hypothetical protein
MRLKLKEKLPMFREELGSDPVWFEAGEEFEVVGTQTMKHDNRDWFKVKSKWFTKPMKGLHNPDDFEVINDAP